MNNELNKERPIKASWNIRYETENILTEEDKKHLNEFVEIISKSIEDEIVKSTTEEIEKLKIQNVQEKLLEENKEFLKEYFKDSIEAMDKEVVRLLTDNCKQLCCPILESDIENWMKLNVKFELEYDADIAKKTMTHFQGKINPQVVQDLIFKIRRRM